MSCFSTRPFRLSLSLCFILGRKTSKNEFYGNFDLIWLDVTLFWNCLNGLNIISIRIQIFTSICTKGISVLFTKRIFIIYSFNDGMLLMIVSFRAGIYQVLSSIISRAVSSNWMIKCEAEIFSIKVWNNWKENVENRREREPVGKLSESLRNFL